MISGWLIGHAVFLLLSWGCVCYEMAHAPTDKELWGEELE